MKKFFKIFAIILIVIIAVIILIPIIFKGKIIELAQEEANNNLNAKVEFADLKLSLIKKFPNISAEIKDLTVVGIDTFQYDTLVSFKKLKATLNLFSVISGDEIEVKQILLDEPDFNIKILEDGTANYDIAIEDTTEVVEEISDEGEDSNFKISLDKFQILNANIIYDDREGDVFAQLKNLNFTLKGDMTEDETNLDLLLGVDSVTVKSEGIKYLNRSQLIFDSEIQADMLNSKYTFKENNLKLNEIKIGFDGYVEMPDEDINMDLTFKAKETKFKDVLSMIPVVYMSDFEGIETSGEFKFDGYAKGIYNDTLMPAYGINLLVKNGYFKYPDLPKSVKNINIDLKVDAEEGAGDDISIDLKKASLTMANNPVSMNAFINMTAEDISMRGNVKGHVNLTTIKDVVPLDDSELSGDIDLDVKFAGDLSDIENENYEEFEATGNLKIQKMKVKMTDMPEVNVKKANMKFSPQFVNLKNFDAKVGKSDLHLEGKIDNLISYIFKDELLTGTFNFTSDLLDLNEMLSLGTEGDETSAQDSEAEETDAEGSEPIEIPANLDFTLNSTLKKIIYGKLNITNAVGKIIIKNSKLDMQQLKMDMLGGSMLITGSFDTKDKDNPFADFNMQISRFDIPEVYNAFATIKQFVPIAENCIGDISAGISFNSVLTGDLMPVFNSINSNGNVSSDKISIKDNKLFSSLADKTKQKKFASPKIKDFDVSYLINNGDLIIKPTKFKIAGTEVNFSGIQKFDRSLDFNLGMMLPGNIAGNLLSKLPLGNSDGDVDVNAKIGGSATNPKITGFSSSLTGDVQDDIEGKIDDLKEDLKEKTDAIKEDAKKEADKIIAEAEKKADLIRKNADDAGKKLIAEAEEKGDKLIREAGNPIAKKAAEITKKELVESAKKQADNLNAKSDKEANDIVNAAKAKADKILNKG